MSDTTLISYLQQMTSFFDAPMCPLERFILECGTDFKGAKRPKGLRKMTNKECYKNATQISQARNLRYVEGFGCHRDLFPMFHAWCLAEDGTVIDPTWRYPEQSDYRGFVIPREIVLQQMIKTKMYGVLGTDLIDLKLIERLRQLHQAQGAGA